MANAVDELARYVRRPNGTYTVVGGLVRGVTYNVEFAGVAPITAGDPVVWQQGNAEHFPTPDLGGFTPGGQLIELDGPRLRVQKWSPGTVFPLAGVAINNALPGGDLEVAGSGSIIGVKMNAAGYPGTRWVGDNGGAQLEILAGWPASAGKVLGFYHGPLQITQVVIFVNPM